MTITRHRLTVRFIDRVTGESHGTRTFDGALARLSTPAQVAADGEWDVEILSYGLDDRIVAE